MPMFFRYGQEDLKAFCTHVSDALRGPCLLYNLPGFTNGLEPDTVVSLLRNAEFIVGIKDSSGDRRTSRHLQAARGDQPWTLLVGNDSALYGGLQAGWNGSISASPVSAPNCSSRSTAATRRDGSTRPRVFRCCSTS